MPGVLFAMSICAASVRIARSCTATAADIAALASSTAAASPTASAAATFRSSASIFARALDCATLSCSRCSVLRVLVVAAVALRLSLTRSSCGDSPSPLVEPGLCASSARGAPPAGGEG